MDDFPRRRRLQPQEPKKGGGIPIFPLIVLVVFAGLLLGGALAKFLNRGVSVATPAPTFTPLPEATPTFAPRATPHRLVSPSPTGSNSPSPTPSASASTSASPSPSVKPSPVATPTSTSTPSVIYITPPPKPKATPEKTPAPATQAPTSAPAAETSTAGRAASIVRDYMAAVLRGDEATAASYLAHGLPNEAFFTGSAKITDLETTHNADGSITVAADITSPTGEFYETFKLAEGPGGLGLQITDHYAIKVQ